MGTKMKGKAIIGISMAAIMIVSVLAATVPMVGAASRGDNFNYILKMQPAQKVLIEQNLQFVGFTGTVTVSRLVSGDVKNVYTTDADDRIYNVNWPTSGAYYVAYNNCRPSPAFSGRAGYAIRTQSRYKGGIDHRFGNKTYNRYRWNELIS